MPDPFNPEDVEIEGAKAPVIKELTTDERQDPEKWHDYINHLVTAFNIRQKAFTARDPSIIQLRNRVVELSNKQESGTTQCFSFLFHHKQYVTDHNNLEQFRRDLAEIERLSKAMLGHVNELYHKITKATDDYRGHFQQDPPPIILEDSPHFRLAKADIALPTPEGTSLPALN